MEFVSLFTDYGLPGLVAAAALWFAWRKDKQYIDLQTQVREIYERMISKEERQQEKYYELALETSSVIKELTEMPWVLAGDSDDDGGEDDDSG